MDLRKIDAKIAEHIMGWEPDPHSKKSWIVPIGDKYEHRDCSVPEYSSDISAAWEVVEKYGDWPQCLDRSGNNYNYRIAVKGIVYTTDAKTAPLAITKAALRVKGIDISDL